HWVFKDAVSLMHNGTFGDYPSGTDILSVAQGESDRRSDQYAPKSFVTLARVRRHSPRSSCIRESNAREPTAPRQDRADDRRARGTEAAAQTSARAADG